MRFSGYNHRLEIQEPVATQDTTTGELVNTWTTICTVWAAIEPQVVRSNELERGDQILGKTYTYLRMRWSPFLDRVTQAHRGKHQGTVFNFEDIAHTKLAQRELVILATSGVNDG